MSKTETSGVIRTEEAVDINVMVETLIAAHFTSHVQSPFVERGGIFLVSPPQQLKSSIIKKLKLFPDAMVVSDLNYQQINVIREDMCTGRYSTLAFVEFNKVYQRNPATSANLEGVIASLTCEGWTGPPHEDQRAARDESRCLVIGGMTKSTYTSRLQKWMENGFAQRFLWLHYKLADDSLIGDSIQQQLPIDLSGDVWTQPNGPIQWNLSSSETTVIRKWIANQPGHEKLPYSLLLKIACVLKWRYSKSGKTRDTNLHMKVLGEFQRLLQNRYVLVTVPTNRNGNHA
jgi:hypothetical protein